jgi:hypothetical protein
VTQVERAPWTDPAWLRTFTGWVETELRNLGRDVLGPPDQPHVRPWSTVLRFETEQGPVWAKAPRRSNAYESRLLPALAGWGVGSVIAPLAVEMTNGWFLLEDGGPTLRQTRPDGTGDADLDAWQEVLRTYADLQRTVETRGDDLLRLGVPDGRPATLAPTMARIVENDTWWELVGPEERAESEAARARLQGLGTWVAVRAAELEDFGIAATIQHDDLHGGNVFVSDAAGIRFFDWGDAMLAHPFGSMVTTLNSVAHRLDTTADDPRLRPLRDAYLEAWTDVLPRAALDEVLEIVLDVGRIGKAAAWAKALSGLDPSDMDGHGDAPALWLTDLVERVSR